MLREIVQILTVVSLIESAACQSCPEDCFCSGIYATCSGFLEFPNDFHTSAEIVSIHRSSLQTLPGHAFANATKVQEIYIYESVIGTIERCAFKGLRNLTTIAIYNSDISTIASGAFSDIEFNNRANTRFSIYQVSINVIEPYAFTSITNAKVFNIYEANITVIEPHAFHKLSHMPFLSIYLSNISHMKTAAFKNFTDVGYVSIYSSYVEKLDCGTFDSFITELGNTFSFYELELNCDCNIAMLLMAARRNPAIVLGRTRCRSPLPVAGISLDSVDVSQICGTGSPSGNCPVPHPKLSLTCGNSPRKDIKNEETDIFVNGSHVIIITGNDGEDDRHGGHDVEITTSRGEDKTNNMPGDRGTVGGNSHTPSFEQSTAQARTETNIFVNGSHVIILDDNGEPETIGTENPTLQELDVETTPESFDHWNVDTTPQSFDHGDDNGPTPNGLEGIFETNSGTQIPNFEDIATLPEQITPMQEDVSTVLSPTQPSSFSPPLVSETGFDERDIAHDGNDINPTTDDNGIFNKSASVGQGSGLLDKHAIKDAKERNSSDINGLLRENGSFEIGKNFNFFWNQNGSTAIAVFTNRVDLMSLIIAFFNYILK